MVDLISVGPDVAGHFLMLWAVGLQAVRLMVIATNFFLGIEQKMADDEDEEVAKAEKVEVSGAVHEYVWPQACERGVIVHSSNN